MDLVNHLSDRLLFAVPKKGRLHQATLDLLAGSDIQFRRETRLDIALVKNLPLALIFLPAADIPTFVGEGRVDLGITGKDQLEEHMATWIGEEDESRGPKEILDLGFGKCRLQVQVPESGLIERPEQLVGKNVVTSFVGLTERYFRGLEGLQQDGQMNGVATTVNKRSLKTKIKYVGGSVEAACPLGVADGVVDLVESGETMKAAGLKAIATVLESKAVMIRSKQVSNQKLVDLIVSRISGFITAQKYVLCSYNVPRNLLEATTKITPGKRAPTITALEDPEWVAVSAMVARDRIAVVMDELEEKGASDILVMGFLNTRTR